MEGSSEQVIQDKEDSMKKVDWQVDAKNALQIKDRVSKTANFLNRSGVPWYLVGGLGAELSNGIVTRDHPDTDVAVFRDKVGDLYDHVTQEGGRFFRSLSKEQLNEYENKYGRKPEIRFQDNEGHVQAYIGNKDELVQDSYSPFIAFDDGEIDVDIIDANPKTGEIPLLGETDISFNKSQYENPESVEINGEKVTLGPPEVTFTHKIIQGREKDRLDLVNTTQELRTKVEKIITDAGLKFKLNNGSTTEHTKDLINQTPGDNPNAKVWEMAR